MAGFFQDLLKGATDSIGSRTFLRDYTHASKTFRTNGYQYAPKLKFLFHVYFDINTSAYAQNVSTGANFGLLVKSVTLPSFTFATHELNQYNRKRIVQTKIKYEPVSIKFHDDNGTADGLTAGGIIHQLWKAYYTYYYKDGTKPNVILSAASGAARIAANGQPAGAASYNQRTTYTPSITGNDDWGYIGETTSSVAPKQPFFNNITIFGFNQHNYTAYTLINPLLTKMGQDTYSYSEGNGTMEMSMDVNYETVVYNEGAMDGNAPGNIVTGFGDNATYDRTLSPIAQLGSNSNVMGKGGLIESAGGFVSALKEGRLLDAAKVATGIYNNAKNGQLQNNIILEAQGAITAAIRGAANPLNNNPFNFPTKASSPSVINTNGVNNPGLATSTPIGTISTAGQQIGGGGRD
jgi:hypothetical protein